MNETVLYYSPKKTKQSAVLKGILVRMKIRIRNISPEQLNRKVGSLAGVSGCEETAAAPSVPAEQIFPDEVLVLHRFSERRLDELLLAMRKAGVRIPLKAVVTESNCDWTFLELCEEVRQEHQRMTAPASENN